jgi:hypothetical protein
LDKVVHSSEKMDNKVDRDEDEFADEEKLKELLAEIFGQYAHFEIKKKNTKLTADTRGRTADIFLCCHAFLAKQVAWQKVYGCLRFSAVPTYFNRSSRSL